MAQHVDYYASLNSPWTHLGAARLEAIVARHGATLRIWPVDFSRIFPETGGLPLPKRAPARQAYRLVELQRWRDHLGISIQLRPRHFPANELPSACAVIAARETAGDAAAIRLAHRVLKALWEEEQDTGDPAVLAKLIQETDLDPAALTAQPDHWAARRQADSHTALARGVFGAPSYVVAGEVFWGQDRLDFLERQLAKAAHDG